MTHWYFIFLFLFNLMYTYTLFGRPGSITVEFKLTFKTEVITRDALAPLRRVITTGNLGSLHVDPTSLKELRTVKTGEISYGFIKKVVQSNHAVPLSFHC